MGLSNAALNIAAGALTAAIDNVRLHTGDPGAAGTSNVATSAVRPVTWGAASGSGDAANSADINFTGGTASGPATHVSLWDGTPGSGGVFMGSKALSGDQTFNAAGEYTIAAGQLSLDGSSPA